MFCGPSAVSKPTRAPCCSRGNSAGARSGHELMTILAEHEGTNHPAQSESGSLAAAVLPSEMCCANGVPASTHATSRSPVWQNDR